MNMKALVRKDLYVLLVNPLTYIVSFLTVLFCAFGFYFFNVFFYAPDLTGLEKLFLLVPYGAAFFIPVIASFLPVKKHFNAVPLYIAVMTVSVFFVFNLFVPVITSLFYRQAEAGMIFSAFIGILLYFSATVSFTVFIFHRMEKKGLAFLVSCLCLLIFTVIHSVAAYVDFPEFFLRIFNFFSFAWHFNSFSNGVIALSDCSFFILLTLFFLSADFYIQEKTLGNRDSFITKIFILSVTGMCLLLILCSELELKIDFSTGKRYSVSAYSKSIIKDVDDTLLIDYYLSPELRVSYPQVRDVDLYLKEYSSFNRKVKYSRINPKKENAEKRIEQAGLPAQQLETSAGIVTVYSSVVISYRGKTDVISFLLSSDKLEYELSKRIKGLLYDTRRSVNILVGNNLTLGNDYSFIVPYLESQGFSCREVYEDNFDTDLSSVLFILGNKELSGFDSERITAFIHNGGKVFVAFQPYTVDFADNWSAVFTGETIERSLYNYGIYPNDSMAADVSNFRLSLYSDTDASGAKISPKTEYVNYSLWPVLSYRKTAQEGITCFWPASFELDPDVAEMEGAKLEPLLYTSSYGWQHKPYDGNFVISPFVVPKVPEDSVYESLVISVLARDEKSLRPFLIVSGDQYMFSNEMVYYVSGENYDLRALSYLSDCLFVLNGEEELLSLKRYVPLDSKIQFLSALDESSYAAMIRFTVMLNTVIPLVLYALCAVAVFIKRRKFNR